MRELEAVLPLKHKERRIVTWNPKEDDILRQQISIHGTDNWTIIASNFKDKTTRQCRRRWYTYLNADFKKGGWSPEEDLLLCEAQKIFGNRWTEIAKVVSGRTDNAVKNRFTTLCKKRARIQSKPKENNVATYVNVNNKRVLSDNNELQFQHSSLKKLRSHEIPNLTVKCNGGDAWTEACATEKHPFAVSALSNVQIEGTFLKKGDPKIQALMQQAELLSSLAMKVNAENTEKSLENASEVLEHFLTERKENEVMDYGMSEPDLRFEHLHDLLEDLRSSETDVQCSQRRSDMYDSPSGSEYSNGSSIFSTNTSEQMEQTQFDDGEFAMLQATETTSQEEFSAISMADFRTPIQITPLFRSFAATVPSPQFSESERHFLMKTLGIESPAQNKSTNPSQPPPCRRALVHSL